MKEDKIFQLIKVKDLIKDILMNKNKVISQVLQNTINRKYLNLKHLSLNPLNMHLDLGHLNKFIFKKIKIKVLVLDNINLKVNLITKKEDK